MGVSHAGAGGEAPRAVGSPSAAARLSGTAGRDSLQSVARGRVAGSPSLSASPAETPGTGAEGPCCTSSTSLPGPQV